MNPAMQSKPRLGNANKALRPLLLFLLLLSAQLVFAKIMLIDQQDGVLTLKYQSEAYQISLVNDFSYIHSENMNYPSDLGAPLLPQAEFKIGIPADGDISITVLSMAIEDHVLQKRILPVPKVLATEAGSLYEYEIDAVKYQAQSKDIFVPLLAGSYRLQSFMPVMVKPFVYDGNLGLKVVKEALIQIKISGNIASKSLPLLDSLSELFAAQLVNKEQARGWQHQEKNPINYADFSLSDWWIRVETDKDGFFQLTPAQLSFLPIADIDPRTFRMFSTGGGVVSTGIVNAGKAFNEVPILVIGEEDGSFDSGDYILFYGTDRNGTDKNELIKPRHSINPYSHNGVYWLTFGGLFSGNPNRIMMQQSPGTWATILDSQPVSMRIEEETHRREAEGFDWYMTKLFGFNTAEYQYQFNLQDVDTAKPQSLQFSITQEDVISTLQHRVSVYMNNSQILNSGANNTNYFTWSGAGEYLFNRVHNFYTNDINTLRLRVTRSGTDNLFFNYYHLNYYRYNIKRQDQYMASIPAENYFQNLRFDFSSTSANIRVFKVEARNQISEVPIHNFSGGFYFVNSGIADTKFWISDGADLYTPVLVQRAYPRDLTSAATQIDNIIVTPDEFASKAEELAAFYLEKYQLKSMVVKQNEIFDQFNGGHPDPAAIKQFVRYAFHNFPAPKLTSLTLLGLGSIDWRNFSKQASERNKVMVYQKGRDVSDDFLGMISTADYPEVAIGRYPARNLAQLNTMLSNMRAYVENPNPGMWRNSVLVVADDLSNGNTTGEYVHTIQAQDTANSLSRGVLTNKVLGMEYDYDEFQNKPKARDDMFAHINDGTLVWYYIGHGSYDKLGAEDYLHGGSDMFRFRNNGRLPLFVAASCKVAHFDHFGFDSLAQKVVLLDNLGAIASLAGTRETYPYQNSPLMISTLNYAVNQRQPVGYSILAAKIGYTISNANDEKYVLLGDPLLHIVPPQRTDVMELKVNGETLTELQSRQVATLTGAFPAGINSGVAEINVFDSDRVYNLGPGTNIANRGPNIFKGSATINNSAYNASFIVPDDVVSGNSGSIVNYFWDAVDKKDYVNYAFPIAISDRAVSMENPDAPKIELYIGNLDFRAGDTVSPTANLIAKISDSNGINITGSAGHGILMILDNASQPLAITNHFAYNLDSYTEGTLLYPFSGLSEGYHTLQLIAFDNLNRPAVANTQFYVKKGAELSIDKLLIYPNPVKKDAEFTFMLSQEANLEIGIYTISGRRIRNWKTQGREGFNRIPWNGRDGDGSRLANNTYFLKIKAKTTDGKSIEKIERIVVYK